ncbi:hypothetical protein OV450_5992, partial [Actinobacteria bacterium OV450]
TSPAPPPPAPAAAAPAVPAGNGLPSRTEEKIKVLS